MPIRFQAGLWSVCIQICAGGLFLASALTKIVSGYASVRIKMVQSGLFSSSVAASVQDLLPWLELLLGASQLIATSGVARVVASVTVVVTLVLMSVVLWNAGIRRGWGRGCGCGEILTWNSIRDALIRNVVLTIVLLATLMPSQRFRNRRPETTITPAST